MLTGFVDFDHPFQALDRIQRQLDRALSVPAGRRRERFAWPLTNVFETKEAFVVKADVPGLAEGDVSVSVEDDALVLRGERKTQVPEGYRVHLRERAPVAFTRTLPLPAKVDTDGVTALLERGVLTVTLPKSRDSLPRQIAIKTV